MEDGYGQYVDLGAYSEYQGSVEGVDVIGYENRKKSSTGQVHSSKNVPGQKATQNQETQEKGQEETPERVGEPDKNLTKDRLPNTKESSSARFLNLQVNIPYSF